MKSCRTCEHYAALNEQCRRNTPTVFLLGMSQKGTPVWAGTWPPTQPSNWCAEHKPSPEPPNG